MRFLAVFLLLAVATLPSLQVQAQEDTNGRVWIIEEEVRCRHETWRETRDILIYGAGRLILEGCDLVLASAPYEDRWLGAADEGIMVHVLLGGQLQLLHSGERPSRIVPEDARHGYRVDVNGVFVSEGRPDDRNLIRGLEGYMAEAHMGGGIRVFGRGAAYLNWTDVRDIQGPALFVQGGEGFAKGVSVENASGAFGAVGGNLVLEQVRVNTGIEGIRVNRANLTMTAVEAASDRAAVYAILSTVAMHNSTLFAYRNALVLDDADAHVSQSNLTYGSVGLVGRHDHERRANGPLIDIQASRFSALKGQKTLAVSTMASSVRVAGTSFQGDTAGSLSVVEGGLDLRGSQFAGEAATDVFAADTTLTGMEGNGYSTNATRPVRLLFGVHVQAVDDGGRPIEGAAASIGQSNGTTGADGRVKLYWEPPVGDDYVPTVTSAVVLIEHEGESLEEPVTMESRNVTAVFAGDTAGIPAAGAAGIGLGLALLAVAVRLRRSG